MTSELQVFNFGAEEVRVVKDEHGEPWWVAKDVCGVLGIDKYRDALTRLDDDERGSVLLDTRGGEQRASTINESGLYSLILRSRKPEAKAFKKWITSVVLPAIRKHGGYQMTEGYADQIPKSLPEALRFAAELAEQKEALAAQNAILAPKADVYDEHYADPATLISLTKFARTLKGLNVNRIKHSLRMLGYLYRLHDASPYRVYSKFRDVLFVEKHHEEYDVVDVFLTPAGVEEVTRLYRLGMLVMKKGG